MRNSGLQKLMLATIFLFGGSLGLAQGGGGAKPEYPASFDPAQGFRPAQADLTEVFLQIAASLEC